MASEYGTMTLGELIDGLEATYKTPLPEYFDKIEDKERQIYFDWCGLRPSGVDSYRGYYDHLAIGIELDKSIYVSELLNQLKAAVGETFHGYKGGNYTMDRKTPVWVANWGRTSGFGIKSIEDDGYTVKLITTKANN